MSVVSIFAASFCEGEEIAKRVAQELGYRLVGDEVLELAATKQNTSAAKLDKVINGYRRFMKMMATTINADTPVITHTYAYLEPRKVGTRFFGIEFNRGWIARHLEHQSIKNLDEQLEIVYTIFDRYHQHISALQQEFPKLLAVDTRRTLLKSGVPNTEWFHDEIHPTSAGFKRVYKKIRKDAMAAEMWPLS